MDGEDVFIDNYFKKNTGFFVDVGAYHTLELNNTYLLYKRGWNGVNIDINSLSIDYFNYVRPDDTNINIAVAEKKSIKTIYYQKKKSPLNTLNLKLASKHFSGNFKKKKILAICTALNDEKNIINFLNKCNLSNYLIILCPHPYFIRKSTLEFKDEFKYDFKVLQNYTTREVASAADFVITGYSSIGLEILLKKIK